VEVVSQAATAATVSGFGIAYWVDAAVVAVAAWLLAAQAAAVDVDVAGCGCGWYNRRSLFFALCSLLLGGLYI
jgi:hypothetical protein